MPLSLGPNTINDSIVFNFDTGDTANSYKGEPTTNLISDPDGNANIITTDVPFGTNVVGYAQYNSGYSVNPRSTTNTSATGNTFTYSVYMRSQSTPASTYLMYVYTGTGPDGGWYYFGDGSLTSDWKRYTYTRSDMTGTVSTVTVYRYNQQGTIDIAAPQIEINSHATQFVKGTRSTTQGLLDLSPSKNIMTLACSYDSSAKMTFDGTDDYISIDNSTSLQVGDIFTINAWIYPTNLNSRYGIFSTRRNNTTGCWQFEVGTASGGTNRIAVTGIGTWIFESPNNVISPNVWTNICFVKTSNLTQGGTLYVNGSSISPITTTAYNILNNSDIKVIGSGTNLGQFFPGRIANVTLYNRILSTSEVQNNYNQYKSRFNL